MELTERLDLQRINYLNDMTYAVFKNYCGKSAKNEDERKKQFNILKNFCKTNLKTRGETKRVYAYTETTPHIVGGRLYCGNSIQGLPSKIRGFLLEGFATDIDMKNAHPTILYYLCKRHSITCKELEYYINHRDQILEESGDRDKTKTLYLMSLNTDVILGKRSSDANFKAFDKEMKEIQKKITAIPEYNHIVNSVPASRTWNWLGSAINRILCVYENKILQEVISVINEKRIDICSLAFDGLLIYGNYYDNDELLDAITTHVEGKFEGLNMKFAYKEHSDVIQMPDNYEHIDAEYEVQEDRTYEAVKERFEQNHCKIVKRAFFIHTSDGEITYMKKDALKTAYENLKYDELVEMKEDFKIVTKSFIQEWLEDEDMYSKMDIGMYPTGKECPSHHYNLWQPFDMELIGEDEYEYNSSAVDSFRNHLKILCGNDNDVFEYFEKWIAQMIQYPAVKSICPTFISKEGAGKSTLIQLLAKMFGKKKVFSTANADCIWGNFNPIMADCFLVNLNELSKKDTMNAEGKIKEMITDPTLMINIKGVSQYPIDSFHRFIITTNSEEPVNTRKDDRRNFIIKCSDELIGNKEYFTYIYGLINDVDAVKSYYEYLKKIPDMANFGKLIMPITEYHKELTELSENIIQVWLKDYVQSANVDEGEYKSSFVYEKFCDWKSDASIEYHCNFIQFAVRLKRLGFQEITVKKTALCNKTCFDFKKLRERFGFGCLLKIDKPEDEVEEIDF